MTLIFLAGLMTLLNFMSFVNGQQMTTPHAVTLTTENFDSVVKANVDAGKTMFVRWIASEG